MDGNNEVSRADFAVLANKLDNLHALNQQEYRQLQKIYEAIYGYDDRPGLVTRVALLEGRMGMLWGAIGVLGSATVVALLNTIMNIFRH